MMRKRGRNATFGYLRVSTDEQDVESQRIGIEKFCQERNWRITAWTEDQGVSGAVDPSRRRLGRLLRKCESGDRIVFSEISRIGRKLDIILDFIRKATKKGIMVYTVKERYTLEDTLQSRVMIAVMGLSADIERSLLRERTREGLRRARAAGKILGRPRGVKTKTVKRKLNGKMPVIAKMLNEGMTRRMIAERLHVHRNTLSSFLKGGGK